MAFLPKHVGIIIMMRRCYCDAGLLSSRVLVCVASLQHCRRMLELPSWLIFRLANASFLILEMGTFAKYHHRGTIKSYSTIAEDSYPDESLSVVANATYK